MIAELKPGRVAIAPADRGSTLAVGGDSVFGPASEFTVDLSKELSESLAVETGAIPKQRLGGELLGDIARASWDRAERLQDSPSAWTQAGWAALAASEHQRAREAFETALNLDAATQHARLGLARTAHEEGRSDEAEKLLRELLESSPAHAEARVSLALVFVSLGRLKEALELLRDEQWGAYFVPTLLAVRGGVRFMINDINGAVSDLRKAVRLKPDWVHARNILGLAELRAGRKTAAERHFRAAARVGPLSLGASLNLVRLLKQDQRWQEILNVIERHWQPGPVPVEIGLQAGEACLAIDDARGARAWLESVRDRGRTPEETAAILNNLGVAYTELSLMEDARKAFSDSLQAAPSEIAATNYGKVLVESGQANQAIEWLQEWSTRMRFESLELGLTLAFALMHAQRTADAIELARILASRPETTVNAFALLSALEADGAQDYRAAVQAAMRGLGRWPESTVLKNNVAYALLMSGQADAASKFLDSIDDSSLDRNERVYVMATRGLLALWRGDSLEGRRLYEAALALAGRESLRERVKAKRDLELARAMLRIGERTGEAVALLERAANAKPTGEPYTSHARNELLRLKAGGDPS